MGPTRVPAMWAVEACKQSLFAVSLSVWAGCHRSVPVVVSPLLPRAQYNLPATGACSVTVRNGWVDAKYDGRMFGEWLCSFHVGMALPAHSFSADCVQTVGSLTMFAHLGLSVCGLILMCSFYLCVLSFGLQGQTLASLSMQL
jgi:hypothetical protein